MYQFAIRLKRCENYDQLLQETFYAKRFSKVLGVTHTGKNENNPHYHIMVDTDYTQQALRKHLQTIFTLGKGNGHISIKIFDGARKGYSYVFHEHERSGFEVVLNRGFTGGELEEFKTMHLQIIENIKDNTPMKMLERVCENLIKEKPNKWRYYWDDIAYLIWDDLKARGAWMPNKFQLERYILKVTEMLTTPESRQWQCWKEQIMEHYFPKERHMDVRK